MKILEPFIEGLDRRQAELSLLKGQISLSNLTLKKDILSNMGLDLELISSRIEKVEVSIPWFTIFSESTKVKIHGIEIHAVRKQNTKTNILKVNRQEMSKLKREALKQTEANHLSKDKKVARS